MEREQQIDLIHKLHLKTDRTTLVTQATEIFSIKHYVVVIIIFGWSRL